MRKSFAAIDLKSFYASVECHERGLDPLATNLVVADPTRTDKTICLAVSPSLKSYGIPGRARLFEVIQKVREINLTRKQHAPLGIFLGKSSSQTELLEDPSLALDFIIAPPRMQHYLDYSAKIYDTYLNFVAPEDIFAYSIDEIFCDLTSYLPMQNLTPEAYVSSMIDAVYQATGITATGGIGTNLFLAKVAMDILAKHAAPNSAGIRFAKLDETSFREQLWTHQPLTDFWRVGRGYTKRLMNHGLFTMGDIARCSLENPKLLYVLFGVNAELLIDHAWGYENVDIRDVKAYQPTTKSLSSGQVLSHPYTFENARTIVKEMAETLSLDLVRKNYLTDSLTLTVNYDHKNHSVTSTTDHYGRRVPKPMHSSIRLHLLTSSTRLITQAFLELYDTKVNQNFTVHKLTLAANNLVDCESPILSDHTRTFCQTDFFTDYELLERQHLAELNSLHKEHSVQQAILKIRSRYGKNAILRGTNFEPEATERLHHNQIGGHRA